jgi:alkylation response protein AidB-like acyl-CoA dehydrogenase
MHFELSSDQKMLAESVASFMKKEAPLTRLRPLREDKVGYSPALWKKMGELGWLGILLPDSLGGYGGSFVDAAILLEEFGAGLLLEPFLASVVLAGTVISRAADDAQRAKYLTPLAAGETTLAFAYAEREARYFPTWVSTRAERTARGYKLFGKKTFVLNGHAADKIVVSARTSGAPGDRDGISLFVVDRAERGIHVVNVPTMDGHRAAQLTFEALEVPSERRLGSEGKAADAIEEALDLGAAAACVESVGLMRAVLRMTTEYLRTREQFGRKIGSFQALQHRAVDMFIETELAKSITIQAAIRANDADATTRKRAISAAKAHVATSGRFVTQQAIQLHGGIGVTDEHDVGLFFKRMHVLNTLFGDEEFHVARFSALPSFATSDLVAG